jgi:RimJ/RimL family protein N-acetyltransferase
MTARVVADGLVLRAWEPADAPAMVELFDDPDVAYWTPLKSPFDLAVATEYVENARRATDKLQLAITTDGVQPLGEVMLNLATGSLGYAIGPAHRGQRLGVRALKALTAYAHETAGLPRVILEIEPDNAASAAVARAAGYRQTDLPPEQVVDKGREVTLFTWEHLAR